MIARHRGQALFAAGFLAATAFAGASCSSKGGSTGFGSDDGGGPGDDAQGGTSSSSSGSSGGGSGSSSGSTGSSSGLVLPDAGGPPACTTGTGSCMSGNYAGTYSCSFAYDPNADGGATDASYNDAGFDITGNISFQLNQDLASGESFIDMASGMFGGTCCAGLFTLNADLGGQLNCNNGTFTGTLTNGTYSGFFMKGSFGGPITACYDGQSSSFSGKWSLTVPNEGTCVGIWTASYTDQ